MPTEKNSMGRSGFTAAILFFVSSMGLGNRPLYEISIVTLLSIIAAFKLKQRVTGIQFFRLCPLLLLIVGALVHPPISQLTILVAITLSIAGSHKECAALLISASYQIATQLLVVTPPSDIISGLLCFTSYAALHFIPYPSRYIQSHSFCALYATLLIFDIASTPILSISPQTKNAHEGNAIGAVIEKLAPNVRLNGMYVLHESKESAEELKASHSVVAEHDTQLPKSYSISTGDDYMQERFWRWNMPIGNDFVRMAVSSDGLIVSNIGTQLTGDGRMVAGLRTNVGSQPLIVATSGSLIFADSDPLLNILAPYQARLIYYLSYSGRILPLVACALALIYALGSLIPSRKRNSVVCLCLGVFATAAIALNCVNFLTGEVRYVGDKPTWPHVKSVYGALSKMQKDGYNFTFGNKDCLVLLVEEGERARWKGELLVILESGSDLVMPGGMVISAGNAPLGNIDQIPDARGLRADNTSDTTGPIYRIGDTIIIGTGSAQLLQYDLLIDKKGGGIK